MSRYLTKSRFRLAIDCPTKLYYTGKKKEYKDKSLDDPFLQALANGGFQVGELAKYYYPGGIEVEGLAHNKVLAETEELLQQEEVILYEPAFRYYNLFIRVDILVKKGHSIQLIEVKSKSFNTEDEFFNRNGMIDSKWKSYFYDVAFQKYVLNNSHPEYTVMAKLMMVDKQQKASIDGLNQKFLLVKENGRQKVIARNIEALGKPILTAVDVDSACDRIITGKENLDEKELNFPAWVSELSAIYERDERLYVKPGGACKKCQFRLPVHKEDGLKSGFHECLANALSKKPGEVAEPVIFDIWNLHFQKRNKFIQEGRYFMNDLNSEDLLPEKPGTNAQGGMARYERQILQLEKTNEKDLTIELDRAGLKTAIANFEYPLHFIDFETSRPAIPFYKDQPGYEQTAFQFSHHIFHKDGKIEHANEWICLEPGVFPNFKFVRALREAVGDSGTIFRYHNHENTVLNDIISQLAVSAEEDKEDLILWIKSITHKSVGQGKRRELLWRGERDMVDLFQLYTSYHYDPATRGSNSLKDVLPAAVNDSKFLQRKYSKPVYGTAAMGSKNFKNKTWLISSPAGIINPYKQLDKLFGSWDRDELDNLIQSSDEVADGGAAMTAYNMCQFSEMSAMEREETEKALLKYCELDTLAMVMLWEYWQDILP